MAPDSALSTPRTKLLALGLLSFVILTLRFSPNWVEFYREYTTTLAQATSPQEQDALKKSFLGYSGRGYHVLRQSTDLSDPISDVDHKIIRWRLLFPALGHFLHLPWWAVLGLSHLGAFFLTLYLAYLGWSVLDRDRRTLLAAFCFALIAGATAPLFTSLGLPGYYDSWLALGILTIAFARSRTLIVFACLATPWVDERLVLGLPLALGIRYVMRPDKKNLSPSHWCRTEALAPVGVVMLYAVFRLFLAGAGGSQTTQEYFQKFIAGETLSLSDRLYGAWAGLSTGWLLILAALAGCWQMARMEKKWQPLGLVALFVLTSILSLFTAVDLSRSMVLLTVLLPLGWAWIYPRASKWRSAAALILAAMALTIPAYHVVGKNANRVDNWFEPSSVLAEGQTLVASAYLTGDGAALDRVKGIGYIRKAADRGYGRAQKNMGVAYAQGIGVEKDDAEAVKWFLKAAESGVAEAQANVGERYAQGIGLPRDADQAIHWLGKAAAQNHPFAEMFLGKIYANGQLTAVDRQRARYWWARATAHGNEEAKQLLGSTKK